MLSSIAEHNSNSSVTYLQTSDLNKALYRSERTPSSSVLLSGRDDTIATLQHTLQL